MFLYKRMYVCEWLFSYFLSEWRWPDGGWGGSCGGSGGKGGSGGGHGCIVAKMLGTSEPFFKSDGNLSPTGK